VRDRFPVRCWNSLPSVRCTGDRFAGQICKGDSVNGLGVSSIVWQLSKARTLDASRILGMFGNYVTIGQVTEPRRFAAVSSGTTLPIESGNGSCLCRTAFTRSRHENTLGTKPDIVIPANRESFRIDPIMRQWMKRPADGSQAISKPCRICKVNSVNELARSASRKRPWFSCLLLSGGTFDDPEQNAEAMERMATVHDPKLARHCTGAKNKEIRDRLVS